MQTDNRATLALVAKMQPHSHILGIIAREMALDVAELAYAPDVINHVPGISNKTADILSRLYAPGAKVDSFTQNSLILRLPDMQVAPASPAPDLFQNKF